MEPRPAAVAHQRRQQEQQNAHSFSEKDRRASTDPPALKRARHKGALPVFVAESVGNGADNADLGWETRGGYFHAKNAKLAVQFAPVADGGTNDSIEQIFKGVRLHIDGRTDPPASQLQRLVLVRGGRYEQFFGAFAVTHVVAENLSASTQRRWHASLFGSVAGAAGAQAGSAAAAAHRTTGGGTRERGGTSRFVDGSKSGTQRGKAFVVVRSAWIIDSISAGRRLDERPYLLFDPAARIGNTTLESTWSHRQQHEQVSAASFKPSDSAAYSGAEAFESDAGVMRALESVNVAATSKNGAAMRRPAATDDGFMQHYLSKSRLHHLSTWRSSFNEQLTKFLLMDIIHRGEPLPIEANSEEVQKDVLLDADEPDDEDDASSASDDFAHDFAGSSLSDVFNHRSVQDADAGITFREGGTKLDAGTLPPSRVVIFHVDMDCFFAQVAESTKPGLCGKPVAVTHAELFDQLSSKNSAAQGQLASCNYAARAKGVRNGMMTSAALALCPDLVCVPYQFDEYERVSKKMYEVFLRVTRKIQVVSVDEALLDVTQVVATPSSLLDYYTLAERIRSEILNESGCTCSVGIGFNVLSAKLACRMAKPNGIAVLPRERVQSHIMGLTLQSLPGVGWSIEHDVRNYLDSIAPAKLQEESKNDNGEENANRRPVLCRELFPYSERALRDEMKLGPKLAKKIFMSLRGLDAPIANVAKNGLKTFQIRKSIGTDINWAVRFTTDEECVTFIRRCCEEVHNRMMAFGNQGNHVDSNECESIQEGLKGRQLQLKIKKRRPDAPRNIEPGSFQGHGAVDNFSKQADLSIPSNDSNILARAAIRLYREMQIPGTEVRGIGITVHKLTNALELLVGPEHRALLGRSSTNAFKHKLQSDGAHLTRAADRSLPDGPLHVPPPSQQQEQRAFAGESNVAVPRLLEDLDLSVLASLPLTLRREIELQYEREFGVRRPLDLISRVRSDEQAAARTDRTGSPSSLRENRQLPNAHEIAWYPNELSRFSAETRVDILTKHVGEQRQNLVLSTVDAVGRGNLEGLYRLLRGLGRRLEEFTCSTLVDLPIDQNEHSLLCRIWRQTLIEVVDQANRASLDRYGYPLAIQPCDPLP